MLRGQELEVKGGTPSTCQDAVSRSHVQVTIGFFRIHFMATPVILGIGAIAAAVLGRSFVQRGLFLGKGAAEQWAKGGFRAKMDRKEAIAILGLKFVYYSSFAPSSNELCFQRFLVTALSSATD